jgi:hypothetical protein
MRRKRFTLAILAGALALLVVGGGAFAALRGDDHGITKKHYLTFVDVTVGEDFLDVGEQAEGEFDVSPGDSFFFHDELWNRAETKKRGTLDGHCTFLIEFNAHCLATVKLPGGTIELAGGLDFSGEEGPGSFYIAITGGTERYENVVGEARLTEEYGGDPMKSLLRLELIPSFSRP